MNLTVKMPKPISANSLFANKGKKRRKSEEYKKWITNADNMLAKQHLKVFTKRVDIIIRVGQGSATADIDNCNKAPIDRIVSAGIIKDDSKKYVRSVHSIWDDTVEGCIISIIDC